MPVQSKLIFDHLGLPTGSLSVNGVQIEQWGSKLVLDCIYRYPPDEKLFRLIFKRCSGLQWSIAQTNPISSPTAQILTHDLGDPDYQRTARIVTVLFEVIVSYGELVVEKGWR